MRFLFLNLLLLIPSTMLAVQKDSIYISQFVKDSFTYYGVRNAFVTVMNLEGNVLDTMRTQPGNGSRDAQIWQLAVPRRNTTYRIRVEHTDYETNEMVVEMKNPASRFPNFPTASSSPMCGRWAAMKCQTSSRSLPTISWRRPTMPRVIFMAFLSRQQSVPTAAASSVTVSAACSRCAKRAVSDPPPFHL